MTTALWILGTLGGTGVGGLAIYLAATLSPRLLPYAIAATIGIACFGSYTIYVRHETTKELLAKTEKEKTDAITKATAARSRVLELCDTHPSSCVPDDWYRD